MSIFSLIHLNSHFRRNERRLILMSRYHPYLLPSLISHVHRKIWRFRFSFQIFSADPWLHKLDPSLVKESSVLMDEILSSPRSSLPSCNLVLNKRAWFAFIMYPVKILPTKPTFLSDIFRCFSRRFQANTRIIYCSTSRQVAWPFFPLCLTETASAVETSSSNKPLYTDAR